MLALETNPTWDVSVGLSAVVAAQDTSLPSVSRPLSGCRHVALEWEVLVLIAQLCCLAPLAPYRHPGGHTAGSVPGNGRPVGPRPPTYLIKAETTSKSYFSGI